MVRKLIVVAALASVSVPAAALAAKPPHPSTPASTNANSNANGTSTTDSSSSAGTHSKSGSAKVLFVLTGTLTGYSPASGDAPGLVSITVKSSNFEKTVLKGQTLAFGVGSGTKIVLHEHAAIAVGDDGTVKVRATKMAAVTTLDTLTASQVLDRGKAP
jgi:hypothetical protein